MSESGDSALPPNESGRSPAAGTPPPAGAVGPDDRTDGATDGPPLPPSGPNAPAPEPATGPASPTDRPESPPDLPASLTPPPGPARIRPVIWAFFGVAVAVFVAAIFVPGESGAFLEASIETVPFAVLGVLAYLGLDRRWARRLAVSLLGFLLLATLAGCLFLTAESLSTSPPDPTSEWMDLDAGAWWRIGAVSVLGFASMALGLGARLGWVQRLFGLGLEGSPPTFVQLLALAAVISLTGLCLTPLLVTNQPPLLVWVTEADAAGISLDDGRGPEGMLRDQLYGLCWTVPATVFAVGFGVRRNWREALERLGLGRLTLRQVGITLGLTVLLLGASYAWDEGIIAGWEWLGWPATDEEAVSDLFAFALTPAGAVVIAVVAGVGEELAVRGVLQPRLGILLPNVFFAALHALQYHWDGLLSVFLTGLVLGWIRRRLNTTASAIVHGLYDFVLIMYEVCCGA